MNVIVYVAFIGIALGLVARYCLADPPRYPVAAVCLACGMYMGVYLLRFIRLRKTWESTFLRIENDRVSGVYVDPRKGTGKPFEIPLSEVEDASLQEIQLTRRAPLPVLVIRTSSESYRVFGIGDMETAHSKLMKKNNMF